MTLTNQDTFNAFSKQSRSSNWQKMEWRLNPSKKLD